MLLLRQKPTNEVDYRANLPTSDQITTRVNQPKSNTLTFRGVTLSGSEEVNSGIRQFVTETLPENRIFTETFPRISEMNTAEGDTTPNSPTEEEIFAFVNPPKVIASLENQQENLIEQGLLKEEQRLILDSNETIIMYFANLAEVYIQYAPLSPAEEQRIREIAIRDLPAIMEFEREKYLRMRARATNPFLNAYYAVQHYLHPNSLFDEFINLLTPSAYAEWVTTTDCYKDDGDTGDGYNGVAFCCNCGLEDDDYVHDCQTNGTACDTQLGCLNSVCENYDSAIWDSTGFICGCG